MCIVFPLNLVAGSAEWRFIHWGLFRVGRRWLHRRCYTHCHCHRTSSMWEPRCSSLDIRSYRLSGPRCYHISWGCKLPQYRVIHWWSIPFLFIQAQLAERVRGDLADLRFFVLSDLWLDMPETFIGIRKMFDHCVENAFIPKVMVLCGNFTSRGIAQGNSREIRRYQGMLLSPVRWCNLLICPCTQRTSTP